MPVFVNLGDIADRSKDPDSIAVIDVSKPIDARMVTHRTIDATANAVARSLVKRGYNRGDRIAILALNRWEYLATFFGIMRAGLVAVPISNRFPQSMIEYVLENCDARLIFSDESTRALYKGDTPVVDFDDDFGSWIEPGVFAAVTPEPREAALFLYTSGSTGLPKGVVLSHQSHVWVTAKRIEGVDFAVHRLLVAAPLFHMNGLCISIMTLAGHGTIVMLPRFSARGYLEAIDQYRCTWLTGVPTMLAMALQEKELLASIDTSHVTILRVGSAPFSQGAAVAAARAFPNAVIVNGYGSTEAGPLLFAPHPGKKPTPPGSVGCRHPDVSFRLVDGENLDATEGVLQIKCLGMMNGYHNLPKKTAEAFTSDGYYVSGDVMRRDPDGFYFFVGRQDDMFFCGGENVCPREVERILELHASVQQACVVPVPDALKGSKPFAFVVLRPGSSASVQELKEFSLKHGPAYQHPRFIEFIEQMPLTGTAKIDTKRLAQRAAEQATAMADAD
jgi:long-chain acyl-CoA synthetase